MRNKPVRVLFLCTGNSARSIMAEAILNDRGRGRFEAHSAGSRPTGAINPAALTRLEKSGHATAGLRSKSWHELTGPDVPAFDCVITVCDHAAAESCPLWPGGPVAGHWGIPDPALEQGDDQAISVAFDLAYERLAGRIAALLRQPVESMSREALRGALVAIGQGRDNDDE